MCEPGSIEFVPTSVGKCTFESARLVIKLKIYHENSKKSQLAGKAGSKNVADDRTLRHSHRSRCFASGTVEVKEATGGTVAVEQWRFHDAVAWQ
ncbi:hypothetical protein WN944_006259 [Citrus x changshan-huyou]|uniref:Uncharacterized protein n=1 Tax=Citrus x changshan-huyou TaxID=2935761 RepID=A0AAP0MIV4_9ROSI